MESTCINQRIQWDSLMNEIRTYKISKQKKAQIERRKEWRRAYMRKYMRDHYDQYKKPSAYERGPYKKNDQTPTSS